MQNAVIEYTSNGKEVKLSPSIVQQYLVKGNSDVTKSEIVMFMQLCKFQGLNPFLNEAYLIKFGKTPAQIITSKEAFMKRADQNPHFKGIKAGIIVARNGEMKYLSGAVSLPDDQLIGGWCDVLRDDREYPIHVEVELDEFIKTHENYKTHKIEVSSTWRSMPKNMIRKTAEVNALREAFPESLGSLYTEEDKQDTEAPKQVQAEENKIADIAKQRQEQAPAPSAEVVEEQGNNSSQPQKETESKNDDPVAYAEQWAKEHAKKSSSASDKQKSSASNDSSKASSASEGDVKNAQKDDQTSLFNQINDTQRK